MSRIEVREFSKNAGWTGIAAAGEASREYCRALEAGNILYFPRLMIDLPEDDLEFLLGRRQSSSRFHKNISYRPRQDVLRGGAKDEPEATARLHDVMRRFSLEMARLVDEFLAPYASGRIFDYASFRPFQERGRDLALHKRNDLLHVDSFPTRPTGGSRILRVFININPEESRHWITSRLTFEEMIDQLGEQAGMSSYFASASSPLEGLRQAFLGVAKRVGLPIGPRPAYDRFMLQFHHFLKENEKFQNDPSNERHEFPPFSTWMVYTDGVAHAALAGQYAMEQTFLIPQSVLVAPELSPLRVLERRAGRPLAGSSSHGCAAVAIPLVPYLESGACVFAGGGCVSGF